MKLPAVSPSNENILCRNRDEFKGLVESALSRENGAFFKILGKVGGNPYYVTVLVDDRKVLAIEAKDVKGNSELVGDAAVKVLGEMLNGATIVDVYPLSDIDVKMSVMENIEVYNATPKTPLSEVLTSEIEVSLQRTAPMPAPPREEEPKLPRPKKQKMEIVIDAPMELDPYFRGLVKHLHQEAKAMGLEFQRVEVHAKEVRYALGAGTGIHSVLKIKGKTEKPVPAGRIKEALTSRAYKEAGEITKETGKKIVISNLELELV